MGEVLEELPKVFPEELLEVFSEKFLQEANLEVLHKFRE